MKKKKFISTKLSVKKNQSNSSKSWKTNQLDWIGFLSLPTFFGHLGKIKWRSYHQPNRKNLFENPEHFTNDHIFGIILSQKIKKIYKPNV